MPAPTNSTRHRQAIGMRGLLVALPVLASLLAPAPALHAAGVSVDFATRETPKLKLGFLHNLSDSNPSDDLLLPLKPRAWRSSETSAPADRVRSLGATQTIVLSDHWSYPMHNWMPAGTPWDQPELYAGWVRQFARRYSGRGVFYWDIWNEPDFDAFWDGTREQFYETFAIAERALREELGPAARIVGPSTAIWRLDWIRGLAEFCLARGCRFDAVSWHDLTNDMSALPGLSERIDRTRRLLSRPRYRRLRVREFHVNEIMGQRLQFKPGTAVGYFSELEDGGADVAIKACWPDGAGRVNCEGQTLDGLLDWDTGRPRSLWHTWRAYADGRASRVVARSRHRRIAVLGSAQSRRPGEAQLLIGNTGTARRKVSARLCGLGALAPGRTRLSGVTVRIEQHPDVEEAVFTPRLDGATRELRVTREGRCAVGRLPVPGEGAALVAYLQAH